MESVLIRDVLDNLPVPELEQSLTTFLTPMTALVPDRRLQRVVRLAVRGILAGETPVVTAMAQSVARTEADPWPAAKRIYRLLDNPRVPPHRLTKGLYHLARATVAQEQPAYLVVAVDPVNFEKPYTQVLAGVSTVRKSTPPNLQGKARLTRGYPAITATVVNTRVPATTYAHWFSYTVAFRSENWEIKRALRMTRAVFPSKRLRFVGDSGLDDQKIFAWIAFGLLLVVASLGFAMLALWLQRRRATPAVAGAGGAGSTIAEGGVPAEQHFPVPIVAVHGLIAATTLILVLLAALHIGGS